MKEKLQEKLKKSREEAEERKKEVEQLQSKVGHSYLFVPSSIILVICKVTEGALLMEGEEDILKGTAVKYFELFPERNYKQGIFPSLEKSMILFFFHRLIRFRC